MKIAFVTDSGCGKTIEELQQDGIYSVPLQVSYDNKNFQDLVDLSIDDVYKLMRKDAFYLFAFLRQDRRIVYRFKGTGL